MNPNELTSRQNIRDIDGERESPEYVDFLASIVASGVIEPICYWVDDAGGKIIQSGHRRHMAALDAGLEDVPTHRVPKPADKEDLSRQILMNSYRKDIDHISLGIAFAEWMRAGASGKEIAVAIGKSESYISQHVSLQNLPVRIRREIQVGNLSYRAGNEMFALDDDDIEMHQDALIASRTVRAVKKQCQSIAKANEVAEQLEMNIDGTKKSIEKEITKEKEGDVSNNYSQAKTFLRQAKQYIQGAIQMAREDGEDISAEIKAIQNVLSDYS